MSPNMLPSETKCWTIQGADGFDSLVWNEKAPIPDLGDHDVLVKIHSASPNYRDLMVAKGLYKFGMKDNVVPGSDGAGEVIAIGSKVCRFSTGDKVMTVFNQREVDDAKRSKDMGFGLGGLVDGTFRQYGVFHEDGLLDMPINLNWAEACTLPCAALTAWNALYGLRAVAPGDVVLTQGTGGVSLFALQFALAAGAKVIATTSSAKKADFLQKLGAHHVLNYREDSNWGATAHALTHGEGVDFVVDVAGGKGLWQSLTATKKNGLVILSGYLDNQDPGPSLMEAFKRQCVVRPVAVGTRQQFYAMKRAVEVNNIKPVIDEAIFKLEDLKDVYQYMWEGKHLGKIAITIE